MTNEAWLSIPGFDATYDVSSHGRVRSKERFDKLGRKFESCILKPFIAGAGYEYVTLSVDGVRHRRTVHSLVALAFVGPRAVGMEVNHRDANKTNNAAENLEYLTRSGQILHATRVLGKSWHKRPGLNAGAKNGSCKLTEDDVRAIRQRGDLETHEELAKQFGVSRRCIGMILNGRTWKSLT